MFSELVYKNLDGNHFRLIRPLKYKSRLLECTVIVPEGFIFDNESIPRIPVLYSWLGRTSDRAGCIHDYLYRKGSTPKVSQKTADMVYREANKVREIGWIARNVKYFGVRLFGAGSFRKRGL
jgi:Protein of unknown function (DUF1353).